MERTVWSDDTASDSRAAPTRNTAAYGSEIRSARRIPSSATNTVAETARTTVPKSVISLMDRYRNLRRRAGGGGPLQSAYILLTADSRPILILRAAAMRGLVFSICSVAVAAVLAGVAGAVEPSAGMLSVEGGKGVVVLELRSSVVLGVLGSGSIFVGRRH